MNVRVSMKNVEDVTWNNQDVNTMETPVARCRKYMSSQRGEIHVLPDHVSCVMVDEEGMVVIMSVRLMEELHESLGRALHGHKKEEQS